MNWKQGCSGTGTPFRFFFWQPEPRSGSFLYKNSSQQKCIRTCYLNSGVPRSWFKQQLDRDQYELQLQHTRFLYARKLAVGAGSQVSQSVIVLRSQVYKLQPVSG